MSKFLTSKAQAWSTDLMLAMIAFGIISVIFYAVVSGNSSKDISTLQDDAEYLSAMVKTSGDSMLNNIVRNNVIDNTRLQSIIDEMALAVLDHNDIEGATAYYNDLKSRLNIDSDFCIYFENKDDRLVIYRSTTLPEKCFGGIGSPEYYVLKSPARNIRCGVPMEVC